MKLVVKKQVDSLTRVEKYDLDDVYVGQNNLSLGLMVCYLLATNQNISFLGMDAESASENANTHHKLHLEPNEFRKQEFTMEQFMKLGLENQIRRWELELSYQQSPIRVVGQDNGTVIEAYLPIGNSINLIPILVDVETTSYAYHPYNPEVVEKMKEVFKLNLKSTIRSLSKLENHLDIYNEFISGMMGDEFEYPHTKEIMEQGFSAKMLSMKYPLSQLGAYNYLIYLRESPEEALEDLKKGLPRK